MNVTRIFRNAAGSLILVMVLGGCESFLDVNVDPNAPENVRVDLRVPAVIGGFGHSVYYMGPQLWSAEWMQQFSYNGETRNYDDIHRYELRETSPSSPWNFYFTEVLNETRLIMAQTDPEVDGPIHGVAKFIWAWTWLHTTDMWGPIPFRQAFDPNIRDPAYDDQAVVYEQALSWIDEAIADMGRSSPRSLGQRDLLYTGDMARWQRLAHMVKARHLLRLSYAPWTTPEVQAEAVLTALQGAFTSNLDDADFLYSGGEGGRNPLWQLQDLGAQLKASAFMVEEVLKAREDPRLPMMVEPALADLADGGVTVYRGHQNGEAEEPDSTLSQVGHFFTNEARPVSWASYSEQKFIEAEAHLILGDLGRANEAYRGAIRANMEKWSVPQDEIDTYLQARPALAALANPLEEIIREKYVANYLKIEPWNDFRRTGYPALEMVRDPFTPEIPVRIRTPAVEVDRNARNVSATGISTGLAGMVWSSDAVWWGGRPNH
jgi:hypothetical protein